MSELWPTLKIGDKVRVTEWPDDMHRDRLHADSQEFLEWLINTRSILAVTEIDSSGLPFGHIVRQVNGEEQSEYWALNHSGLEIVSS